MPVVTGGDLQLKRRRASSRRKKTRRMYSAGFLEAYNNGIE